MCDDVRGTSAGVCCCRSARSASVSNRSRTTSEPSTSSVTSGGSGSLTADHWRVRVADKWRVRVADPATGDAADPFDCFYDASDPRRVIPHKTYSRADVVHCMLWPSLVVVASAAVFLYLEARRSRLTFCGRRPSVALAGEKSQLNATTTTPHHHASAAKHHHDDAVNDDVRHLVETSSRAAMDLRAARHRAGRWYHGGGGERGGTTARRRRATRRRRPCCAPAR